MLVQGDPRNGENYIVEIEGEYNTQDECFIAHDKVVEEMFRPIVNYRPVCLLADPNRIPRLALDYENGRD